MKLWRKAKAEQSADDISYGLAQLVLDVLKTTCEDTDANDDFTLPTNIDAATLNDFIVNLINGKVSKNGTEQKIERDIFHSKHFLLSRQSTVQLHEETTETLLIQCMDNL